VAGRLGRHLAGAKMRWTLTAIAFVAVGCRRGSLPSAPGAAAFDRPMGVDAEAADGLANGGAGGMGDRLDGGAGGLPSDAGTSTDSSDDDGAPAVTTDGSPMDGGSAAAPSVCGIGDLPVEPRPQDLLPPPPPFVREPATQAPFACKPLPSATFFPAPGPEVPGLYSRYASYAVGAASSASVNPDGRLAVLATDDGIARVVELATGRVTAVLALPRSMINLVAFSPDGDAILTVARGERQATLWRVPAFSAKWTTALPGLAFAPDGASVVVSPGRASSAWTWPAVPSWPA
jgi:hypothetical protein